MMRKTLEKKADEADALIRYFEERGRRVTGVTLDGKVIHLDFGMEEQRSANPADLVRMDD